MGDLQELYRVFTGDFCRYLKDIYGRAIGDLQGIYLGISRGFIGDLYEIYRQFIWDL